MMLSRKFVLVSIIWSSVFLSANAIRCYQCSSVNDTECLDFSSHPPNSTAAFYMECEDFEKYGNSTPFCRKTAIEILIPHEEKRTTRSCGWLQHQEPCYKANNVGHKETSCQCFEDGCNGSNRIPMIGAVSSLILSFFFCCKLM